ncbi:ornithine cyclodeaminase family protein [Actinoplanes sp. NPDC051470]|uniref:ornithine cyclodeaminase family protein n=1 Tax=Actinoplanes sp. NPDC051470 TaxID=3157224 RepID=UPI0034334908
MLRIIDGDAVRDLYPIADAVPDMAAALIDFSAGTAYQHPRVTLEPPGHDGRVLVMPAASGDVLGLKLLSMFPRAGERGLPGVQGLVILLDAVHGEPLAVIDGTAVTEIRTAAVTALATDRLAPAGARTLGLIGAGVQARGHLVGLAKVRPWESVKLYSRSPDRSAALAKWAQDRDIDVEVVGSARAAAQGAQVICTVTSASEPVIADEDVAGGDVHVNAIGAFGPTWRELPSALVARSRIVVDSRGSALREAGDLMIPLAEGVITEEDASTEIGEILAGTRPGREGGEVTTFVSLGLPIEDVVACDAIYRRAVEQGVGHEVRFP